MAFYVDTSAVLKLVTAERESGAIHEWVALNRPVLLSSDLLLTEIIRSGRRVGADSFDLAEAIGAIDFVPATSDLFRVAAELPPQGLRTLDALHVATALQLDDDCEAVVTYDSRMQDAVVFNGMSVLAPS